MIIVDVILPFPIREYFSYILPYSMSPIIGGRVLVPFHSKDTIGVIVAIHQKKNINNLHLKLVKRIIDNQPILNDSLLNILIWLSKYYHYPIGSMLFSILPNILKAKDINEKNKKFCFKKKFTNFNYCSFYKRYI